MTFESVMGSEQSMSVIRVSSYLKVIGHLHGNDGLTVEFYRAFWHILGSVMVDSLNCSYDYGELSNSQKEALITLIEKKIKTRGTRQTGDRFLSLMLTLK